MAEFQRLRFKLAVEKGKPPPPRINPAGTLWVIAADLDLFKVSGLRTGGNGRVYVLLPQSEPGLSRGRGAGSRSCVAEYTPLLRQASGADAANRRYWHSGAVWSGSTGGDRPPCRLGWNRRCRGDKALLVNHQEDRPHLSFQGRRGLQNTGYRQRSLVSPPLDSVRTPYGCLGILAPLAGSLLSSEKMTPAKFVLLVGVLTGVELGDHLRAVVGSRACAACSPTFRVALIYEAAPTDGRVVSFRLIVVTSTNRGEVG